MALAGHAATLRIRTSSGIGTSGDDCDGAQQFALNRVKEELETTDLLAGVDRTYITGLLGGEIPISGDYESGDTPQGRLLTAFGDGSSIWAVMLWNGSAGVMVETKVTKFDLDVGFDKKVTFSATLKLTGAVATAA